MIIGEDEEMTKCLSDNPSESVLKERLIEIVKKGKSMKAVIAASHEEDKGTVLKSFICLAMKVEIPPKSFDADQITSPTDSYLSAAKKKRRKTTPVYTEDSSEPSLAKNLKHCDIGLSPPQQKLESLKERIGYQDD